MPEKDDTKDKDLDKDTDAEVDDNSDEDEGDVELEPGFTYEDDTDSDDDEDLDEETQKKVQKATQKALQPTLLRLETQAKEAELKAFYAEYPELKVSEATVRKYMIDKKFSNLPVRSIALMVNEKRLGKLYADRTTAAAKKAKESDLGGGGSRGTQTKDGNEIPNAWDLDDAAFKQMAEDAKRGKYTKS